MKAGTCWYPFHACNIFFHCTKNSVLNFPELSFLLAKEKGANYEEYVGGKKVFYCLKIIHLPFDLVTLEILASG